MKVNADSIAKARKQRSWSQDELATAAGLNLRTVQRIENEGSASLESMKALAAALQLSLEDFKTEKQRMTRYEYKTIVLPFKFGFMKKGLPDIQSALNEEGGRGWRLNQMIMSIMDGGRPDSIVAVFERPLGEA